MKTVRALNAEKYFTGQSAAHAAVHRAIGAGELKPATEFPCVDCGDPAQGYDHRDYNKPLEVEPVCNPCNGKRGRAIPLANPEPVEVEVCALPSAKPRVVDIELVSACTSYRLAVLTAWSMRSSPGMTKATLAEMTGMWPSHITDFLNESGFHSNGTERRDMPAKFIPAFERAVGNTFVTQWLAYQSSK